MDTGDSWQLHQINKYSNTGKECSQPVGNSYKLQYSEDGVNFYYYKVLGQSSPKVNVEAVTWFKTVKNISLCLHSIEVTVIICCK